MIARIVVSISLAVMVALGAQAQVGQIPQYLPMTGIRAPFTSYFGVQPPPGYTATVPYAFELVLSEINGSAQFPTLGSPTTCLVGTRGAGVVDPAADCNSLYTISQQFGGECISVPDGGGCTQTTPDSTHIRLLSATGAFEVGDMLCFGPACDTNKAQSWITASVSCGASCIDLTTTGNAGATGKSTYATAPIVTIRTMYDLLGAANCNGGLPCDMPRSGSGHPFQLLSSGFGPGGTKPCMWSSAFGGANGSPNSITPATAITVATVGKRAASGTGNTWMSNQFNSLGAKTGGGIWQMNGNGNSDVNAADDAFHVGIGALDNNGTHARFNVDGVESTLGATVNTSAGKPTLSLNATPQIWVCEAGFGTPGFATDAQRKAYCQAETTRWGVTPAGGLC